MKNLRRRFAAALLVGGTCIGVGMLAMPVATYQSGFTGFLPTIFLVWLFVNATSFLIVEACLWCPKGSNLITISKILLGSKGAAFCWLLYLFLFYSLMIAQIAGGGQVVDGFIYGGAWPDWISTLIFVLLFAPFVYLGTKWVARLNIFLMGGLVLSFLYFFPEAIGSIRIDLFKEGHLSASWKGLPILLTAFGFQNLIPTLLEYLNRNGTRLLHAIWIGTSIPLGVYLIWEWLILGIVPPESLAQALAAGQNAVVPLEAIMKDNSVARCANAFAFFALGTTFIGMGIAFTDFWADGLNWKKEGAQHLWLLLLVFGIPYAIACIYPDVFFFALDWAGGIGASLFIAILPLCLVYAGRYIQKRPRIRERLGGGKIVLGSLFTLTLLIIAATIASHFKG